jgi:5-methyltetrahydropteroyltriglutamate--homocysteine methyltransferase
MKRSTDRILTTHVGSLIRPAPLQEFLRAKQAGKSYDRVTYEACLKSSVAEVVREQAGRGRCRQRWRVRQINQLVPICARTLERL